MLLHRGEEKPLALPCPCHLSPAPRGYPSTVRHHTRTCGQSPLQPPRESRKRRSSSQRLQRHRCPMASCTTLLRCCWHPPSYLRRVPSAP